MLDGLSTIVDQFEDSVGLPTMGHLEKLKNWHSFSRDKSTVFQSYAL